MRAGLNKRAIVDIFERSPVRVYDVAEKKLIAEYESIGSCANAIGLKDGDVMGIINHKRRNKTNNLGLTITIRRAPVGQS